MGIGSSVNRDFQAGAIHDGFVILLQPHPSGFVILQLQHIFLLQNDVVHLLSRLCGIQIGAEFIQRHEPADSRQSVDMKSGLIGWAAKQPDEGYRLAVDALIVDWRLGFADRQHQMIQPRDFPMRDRESISIPVVRVASRSSTAASTPMASVNSEFCASSVTNSPIAPLLFWASTAILILTGFTISLKRIFELFSPKLRVGASDTSR